VNKIWIKCMPQIDPACAASRISYPKLGWHWNLDDVLVPMLMEPARKKRQCWPLLKGKPMAHRNLPPHQITSSFVTEKRTLI
jgi:hypothetical protein